MAFAVLGEAHASSAEEVKGAVADISAGSVLPAHREDLELFTADGLRLVGELATPIDVAPVATIICLHPLTTHGGMMDSHVLRKMAWRLPALAGIAVLRFNMRGAVSALGASEGSYDEGLDEGLDLAAALAEVQRRGLPDPWIVGWSFGTAVALRHGNVDPVRGVVLLSPPLRGPEIDALPSWVNSLRPMTCLIPENDDYLKPDEARAGFAAVPHAEVIAVEGAGHLWVGERFVRVVLDEIVQRVLPGHAPLPVTWDGPMEKFSEF